MCSVESTRWPVSDASMAMVAVSRSRISPTRTMSGSDRRIDRSAEAKVRPALGLTWTWLTPAQAVLDRVLDGDDVLVGRVEDVEGGVERRRLARPGRAGDEDRPVGLAEAGLEAGQHRRVEPEVGEAEAGLGLVQDPHDDLLAVDGRQGGHPEVDRLAGDVEGDAAVLGDAAFGDVDVGHDLEPADHPALDRPGRVHDLVEHAVDPEPDPQVVLGRLDVDVRRPVGHRLGDEEVDELDDGGVLDVPPGPAASSSSSASSSAAIWATSSTSASRRWKRSMASDELGAGGDDDRDLGAGHGPDVVDGQDVAGVGHGHHQARPRPR